MPSTSGAADGVAAVWALTPDCATAAVGTALVL